MKKFFSFAILAIALVSMVLVGCTTAASVSSSSNTFSVTIPKTYASHVWGDSGDTYLAKFVLIKDSVLANLNSSSAETDIFNATNQTYVYCDSTVGNGQVDYSALSSVATTPTGSSAGTYAGVSVTSDGTNVTFSINLDLLNDTLQLKVGTTSADETDAQAASNVATGYTPVLVGSVVGSADTSADTNYLCNLWATYWIKMSK